MVTNASRRTQKKLQWAGGIVAQESVAAGDRADPQKGVLLRKATGKAVLHCLTAHTELLIASGLLQEWDDGDRCKIEQATAWLLALLAKEVLAKESGD